MLRLGNKTIVTPIPDILKELKYELELQGINKLRDIKHSGQNLQVTCPCHKHGLESKPSCGIFLSKNGNFEEGDFHCFTCGQAGSFDEFVSYCFDRQDGGLYGLNWVLSKFEIGESNSIELAFNKPVKAVKTVTDDELESYRYYHEYMWKRGLTPEVVEQFDVGYDIKTDCITFPVNDEFGNCVFVARRSTKGKWFNYPSEVEKPVYALDKITENDKEVYVVESFFNCLTLWKWGKKAVALMGTGSENQYEILKRNKTIQRYILAFDGDNAGKNGAIKFHKNMKDYALISYIDVPLGKDINDLSFEEFSALKAHI